jgi:antagonist of KipI
MPIKILHKGLADSLQDKGRYGYQHLGISPNGYMDNLSATLANYILQNDKNEALIELHFPSSEIQFLEDYIICIAGANFVPILNGKSMALNKSYAVKKNDILTMLQPIQGRTAYIAIKSTCSEPNWLNSHSMNGLRFVKDQVLNFTKKEPIDIAFNEQSNNAMQEQIIEQVNKVIFNNNAPIRILPGPAWQDLSNDTITKLLHGSFSITTQANRMGFYLSGPSLSLSIPNAYLSSAVTRGTLQLLPSGELIVLMADHQTIGGYANLGQIILVDLPRFAQMKLGQPFKFSLTNLETAQSLFREMYAPFKY